MGLRMKKLLIALCALAVLPGAALAQQHGGGGAHGGGGQAGGGRAAGGWRGGGGWNGGGWRGGGWRGGGWNNGFRTHFFAGPVGHFGARDFAAWRGGFWWHGFRGGRIGWWWFAGGGWYWYAAPLYPYPDYVADYYIPSDAYQPPGALWYYCYDPAGYYPYVHACPSGWRPVTPNYGSPPQ